MPDFVIFWFFDFLVWAPRGKSQKSKKVQNPTFSDFFFFETAVYSPGEQPGTQPALRHAGQPAIPANRQAGQPPASHTGQSQADQAIPASHRPTQAAQRVEAGWPSDQISY